MKKLKALLVAVVMVIAGIPLVPGEVRAGKPAIRYQKATVDPSTHAVTFSEETAESYTVVTTSDNSWGTAGKTSWYVVNSSFENTNRITVSGTVNLILCDGATLTATKGITVADDDTNLANGSANTLNIYGQSTGDNMGILLAGTDGTTPATPDYCAGIGGKSDDQGSVNNRLAGTITINGGKVEVTGGRWSAGIGGGNFGSGGTITINGGTIKANGDSYSAGIGGGKNQAGGTITINNGNVTANGGDSAAGIGGGKQCSGGNIIINGGTVIATGGSDGAGIGGGAGEYGTGGSVAINGGNVTANGTGGGAGIGGGYQGAGTDDSKSITISGGTVMASGSTAGGAGIGGGYQGAGTGTNGKIEISDSVVTATGGNSSAKGIGAGDGGSSDGTLTLGTNVKLYGSDSQIPVNPTTDALSLVEGDYTRYQYMKVLGPISYMKWDDTDKKLVPASTGSNAYTIVEDSNATVEWNGGWYVVAGNNTIGGQITATGTVNLILCDGATLKATKGITVQDNDTDPRTASTNILNIYAQSGGTGGLTVTGDSGGAGIGGYVPGAGGTVTINGGTVTATGGSNGAGIGGGHGGAGGSITINGGSVTATGGDNGAGIGGGNEGAGGTITINGGTVTATGGKYAAGIGGGYKADGGTITINSGVVNATGGAGASGIGVGAELSSACGTVIVNGGKVTAKGGNVTGGTAGSGIDGGDYNPDPDTPALTVKGSPTITATGGSFAATGDITGGTGIKGGLLVESGSPTIIATGGAGNGSGSGGDGINGKIDESIFVVAVTVTNGSPTITATGGNATTGNGGRGINMGTVKDSTALKITYGSPQITSTGGNSISGNGCDGIYGPITITTDSETTSVLAVHGEGEGAYAISGDVTVSAGFAAFSRKSENDPWNIHEQQATTSKNLVIADKYGLIFKLYCSVVLDKNGGSGIDVNPLYYRLGETITLPANTYTRSGYSFTGWNTKKDGSGTSYADGVTVTLPTDRKDLDQFNQFLLYAQWKEDSTPTPGPGPSPTPAPEPEPKPEPEPETPTIDPGADPTAGEKIDESTKEESTAETPTGGSENTTTYKTEDGKDVTIVETAEPDGSTSKSTVVESETEKKEQTTSTDADGNVTKSARVEDKTTGDYTESTKVTNTDGTTEERNAFQETKNGVVTEGETTKTADGSTTEFDKVTQKNEDFEQTYVEKDPNGNETLREESSKVTAADGTVSERDYKKDATGETETVTSRKDDDNYSSSMTVKDADGKLVSEKSESVETRDGVKETKSLEKTADGSTEFNKTEDVETGDFAATETVKDASGQVLTETTETKETAADKSVTETKKTDDKVTGTVTEESKTKYEDNTSIESKAVTTKDGTEFTTVTKDASGAPTAIEKGSTDAEGNGTSEIYGVDGNEASLSVLATGGTEANVPDSITDLNGKSIPVTTIGEGAIPAVETVNVGENVNKIEKNAFKDSGAKTINFTSKVTKSMFDKNSLAGAGGKKGKGLKITVQTKKDQKAMKKALKKAGVPKAKVKIAK